MREMKDSGIEWIGKVPVEWKIDNPQYHFSQRKDRAKQGMVQLTASQKYGVITQTEYMERTGANIVTVQKDFDILKLVCAGDFVIHMRSFQGGLEYSEKTGSISSAYVMLIPRNTIREPRYYKWFFKSSNYIDALSSTSNLVRDGQAMRWSNFIQLQILFPPAEEQQRIADFLDAKCAEIDALTADIQTQIDTLEQYKRSVITETVTKGLNPDAEMKDSGAQWVGRMPSSWRMLKGKYMFAQRSLRGNSRKLQLLSPTQKFGVIPQTLYEELSGMSAVKLNEKTDLSLLKTIHKGDFCISLRSFQGGFEYSKYEGVVSPAYQVFYPTLEIADDYYKYLFKEQGFIDRMNSYTMTLRDGKNIAFSDFGNTYIPYPPLTEQLEIAIYLDRKCTQIDALVTEKQQQLATLDEYKKSLIFEYVTGKKEVPLS